MFAGKETTLTRKIQSSMVGESEVLEGKIEERKRLRLATDLGIGGRGSTAADASVLPATTGLRP